MSAITTAEYKTFLKEIKERIHKAQYDAFKSVNRELINLYWDIGRSIVAKQEKLGWGKSVVESLAKDLQKEFSGIQGFSSANLWRMRNFYLSYRLNEKLAPLVREISWTKNIIIMERCKENIRREFYFSALNERAKLPDENPSIGIILCKGKSRTIVEYALKDTKKPIGVSTYRLTEKLPRNLKKYLPAPEEMIKRLEELA